MSRSHPLTSLPTNIMKSHRFALYSFMLTCGLAFGQGTFIFDQQSSTETNVLPGGVAINPVAMPGQSFTPSLSAVGFIRLFLTDTDLQDGIGATFYINLRSNSISGAVIGS